MLTETIPITESVLGYTSGQCDTVSHTRQHVFSSQVAPRSEQHELLGDVEFPASVQPPAAFLPPTAEGQTMIEFSWFGLSNSVMPLLTVNLHTASEQTLGVSTFDSERVKLIAAADSNSSLGNSSFTGPSGRNAQCDKNLPQELQHQTPEQVQQQTDLKSWSDLQVPHSRNDHLQNLRGRLDQLLTSALGLEDDPSIFEDSNQGCVLDRCSWASPYSVDSETTSCSSASNSWVLTISNSPMDGSGTSKDTSGSDTSSHHQSMNSCSSTQSSANKRPFASDWEDGDGEADEHNKKFPRRLAGSHEAGGDVRPEKGIIQIPCFIDDCPGKDAHISELT